MMFCVNLQKTITGIIFRKQLEYLTQSALTLSTPTVLLQISLYIFKNSIFWNPLHLATLLIMPKCCHAKL